MDERYRTAARSALAHTLSKALAFVLMTASMAATLGYLGAERFGIWMTVAAFCALAGFLDLGIADSLRNAVSRAAAHNDQVRVREILSNGLLLLCAVGALVGLVLTAMAAVAPWPSLVKLEDATLYPEVSRSATLFAALFAIGIPLSGVQRAFHGLQQGYLVHAVSAGASCISLLLLFPLTRSEAGIPALIIATYGLQVLAPLTLLPLLVRRGLIGFSTARFRADASFLASAGAVFFALQVGWMIGWGSDRLIASALLGAKEVALLAVAAQLFQLVTQPLALANGPLWSAYAHASEQRDKRFISTTLAHSVSLTLFAAVFCSAVVIAAHERVLQWWIGPQLTIPFDLLLALAALSIFQSVGDAFAMYLNGTGVRRPQLHVVLLFCTLAIPLKFILAPLGVAGIVLASLIAYALAVALPYATVYRYTWAAA